MVQYSNFDRVMEARNHFKNGAISKSLTSRENFSRKTCFKAKSMKYLKLTTLIFIFLFLGCNQSNKRATLTKDKEKLQELVRQLYEWRETKTQRLDFAPVADSEGRYIGLDLQKHEQSLTELKQSGFFAEHFLENYNRIAVTIDNGLKNGTIEWLVGYLPPFGNGASPWCNCQDNPDKYWQTMIIDKVELDNTSATFSWTWVETVWEYKVEAIKENDRWLITYLQGFDFNEFFLTK